MTYVVTEQPRRPPLLARLHSFVARNFAAFVARRRAAAHARRDLQNLQSMPDYLLRDIGLHRGDIEIAISTGRRP